MRFMESCVTGVLPGGKLSRYASISANYFNVQFGLGRLPAGLPLVSPTSPDLTNPLARVFEAFGSNTNQAPLLLADRIMNQVKGNLIGLLKTPLKERTLSTLIESGMGGNFEDRIKWLSYMQRVRAVPCPRVVSVLLTRRPRARASPPSTTLGKPR
jgi:hypothetical protein